MSGKQSREPDRTWAALRYRHHHREWSARAGHGQLANRHLYAARAHLRTLGWLSPEYDRPALGVYDRDGAEG